MNRPSPSRLSIVSALITLIAACALLLAGCGGGGGGGSSSTAASSGGGSGSGGGTGGTGGGITYGTTCFSGSGTVTPGQQTPDADLSSPWPPAPCAPPVACSEALTGTHATYNVGASIPAGAPAGTNYPDMTSMPWLSLQAGDVVNIYPGTYKTKVGLSAQGTASAPVIINGVTDASCNRPIVEAAGAVTADDAKAKGFFTGSGGSIIEGEGAFVLWWNDSLTPDNFGFKPSFIAIQNLQIQDANSGQTYVNSAGSTVNWATDASGVYAVVASVLTVQNCLIINNGEGVFVNSKNNDGPPYPNAETSFYVTLRGNSIYNNGVVNSYTEHNVYVQGVRSLYEGNYIGQLIPNAQGGSLKDRSSGPVVRFNSILAAARAIDLVDNEGGSPGVAADPVYKYGWIYGNLIVNGQNGSGDLIHWGGDSTEYNLYHQGPLSVYFNTIVNTIPTAIFDMSMATQSVNSYSNIISSTQSLAMCTASAQDGSQVGAVNLYDKNWIQAGFDPTGATQNNGVAQCTFSNHGALLAGSPVLTATYGLDPGSPAIGAGISYPVTSPVSPVSVANLIPTYQPATTASGTPTYVARSTVKDVGAFAGP